MLNVEWATGCGYGDFVTGLGYAHTSSVKYRTPVHINFHWFHSKDFLYHPNDPETIVERCDYVKSVMKELSTVTYSHVYDSTFNYRFINNFDEFSPYHGLWYSNLTNTKNKNVVIWTTRSNKEFPGASKDPSHKMWDKIVERIEQYNYNVIEVTYRTPVKEVVEHIRTCAFGVGYDGLAHQIFKFMWKPLIVICKRVGLNRLLIPQAVIESNPNLFLTKSLNSYLDIANKTLDVVKINHQRYMEDRVNYYEHPLFNTPVHR